MSIKKRFDRSLWIRFWGEMIVGITMFMIWPFLAIYLHNNLGVSYTTIGLVLTLGPITATIGSMVGGQLADKWGRRPVMLVSLAADVIVLIGFAMAHTLWMFAVCIVIQGIFNSMYAPAANAMVADVTPQQHRQEAYGLLRIAMNVGSALGPLLGMVAFFATPSLVFLTASGIILLFMIVSWIWVPETLGRDQETVLNESNRIQTPDHKSFKTPVSDKGYRFIFQDRLFLLFLVSGIIGSMAYSQTMITFPLYLDGVYHATDTVSWARSLLGEPITAWLNQQLSSGAKLFALLLSMNSVMVVCFQMPVTRWVAPYRVGIVLAVGAFLEAAGLLMLSGSPVLWWLVCSFTIFTIGEMLKAPTFNKLVADLSPDDMRGRYMGAASLQWIIGNGSAPVLGGILLDRLGGETVMLSAGFVGLLSALGYVWVNRMLAHKSRKIDSIEPQTQASA